LRARLHRPPGPFPPFNVKIAQTSVSSLSAGGYMATQFEVALSSMLKGAGVIAGGPITVLDYRDFRVQLRPVRVLRNEDHECAQSHPHHRSKCRAGFDRCNIEPPKRPFLALFWNGQHGGAAADHERPKTYLLRYVDGGTIFYKNDLAVQHAQPTDFFGNPCNVLNDLFINNCNYDAAGQLLQWISGTLPPHNRDGSRGLFIQFDQTSSEKMRRVMV
jgi:hypothetical protein